MMKAANTERSWEAWVHGYLIERLRREEPTATPAELRSATGLSTSRLARVLEKLQIRRKIHRVRRGRYQAVDTQTQLFPTR